MLFFFVLSLTCAEKKREQKRNLFLAYAFILQGEHLNVHRATMILAIQILLFLILIEWLR